MKRNEISSRGVFYFCFTTRSQLLGGSTKLHIIQQKVSILLLQRDVGNSQVFLATVKVHMPKFQLLQRVSYFKSLFSFMVWNSGDNALSPPQWSLITSDKRLLGARFVQHLQIKKLHTKGLFSLEKLKLWKFECFEFDLKSR